MAYRNIFFDLDGTLTDPREGTCKAVRHALRKFGIEIGGLEEVYDFIGPPLGDSFRDHYGFGPAQCQEAIAYYRDYYEAEGIYQNSVYPGIPELLEGLVARGFRVNLASSKPEAYAAKVLELVGIKGFFHVVGGANLDDTRSEKAEVLAYALGLSPSPREEALMVGDRKFDVLGARANGVDSLAVGYGFGSPAELDAAGPTHRVATIPELQAFFDRA